MSKDLIEEAKLFLTGLAPSRQVRDLVKDLVVEVERLQLIEDAFVEYIERDPEHAKQYADTSMLE